VVTVVPCYFQRSPIQEAKKKTGRNEKKNNKKRRKKKKKKSYWSGGNRDGIARPGERAFPTRMVSCMAEDT